MSMPNKVPVTKQPLLFLVQSEDKYGETKRTNKIQNEASFSTFQVDITQETQEATTMAQPKRPKISNFKYEKQKSTTNPQKFTKTPPCKTNNKISKRKRKKMGNSHYFLSRLGIRDSP